MGPDRTNARPDWRRAGPGTHVHTSTVGAGHARNARRWGASVRRQRNAHRRAAPQWSQQHTLCLVSNCDWMKRPGTSDANSPRTARLLSDREQMQDSLFLFGGFPLRHLDVRIGPALTMGPHEKSKWT